VASIEIVGVGHDVNINGTSFVGQVTATYDELVACFKDDMGASFDGKTRFQFAVEFFDVGADDYVVASLYDWKLALIPREDILVWNVGGTDVRALIYVEDTLHKHRFPDYKPSEDYRNESSI
jgi:hypothetical protein